MHCAKKIHFRSLFFKNPLTNAQKSDILDAILFFSRYADPICEWTCHFVSNIAENQ